MPKGNEEQPDDASKKGRVDILVSSELVGSPIFEYSLDQIIVELPQHGRKVNGDGIPREPG